MISLLIAIKTVLSIHLVTIHMNNTYILIYVDVYMCVRIR